MPAAADSEAPGAAGKFAGRASDSTTALHVEQLMWLTRKFAVSTLPVPRPTGMRPGSETRRRIRVRAHWPWMIMRLGDSDRPATLLNIRL